jgi:streptomycin 6-kinase
LITVVRAFFVVGALPVLVDQLGQPVRDPLVGVARRTLVDQRRPHVVVTHARHQVLGRRARLRRPDVPGVPEVMEVQAHADAQTTVTNELARLRVGPRIHAAITTHTGTWTVMDHVTPGTPLADADPRAIDFVALTAPLRAMDGVPAPSDELPNVTEWLRERLLDNHLSDLPPRAVRAGTAERRHALELLNELTTDPRFNLCHGDASPWNILADTSGQWLQIDPRGACGEVEYDAAIMALKISTAIATSISVATSLVADATKVDLERVRAWATVARTARA